MIKRLSNETTFRDFFQYDRRIQRFDGNSCGKIKSLSFPNLETSERLQYFSVPRRNIKEIYLPKYTGDIFIRDGYIREIYAPKTKNFGSFGRLKMLEKINIESVTRIWPGTFTSCTRLRDITAPNVLDVEGDAFLNCRSLKSINMPDAIISDRAFNNCTNLSTVSVGTIRLGSFSNCRKLASLVCKNTEGAAPHHLHSGYISRAKKLRNIFVTENAGYFSVKNLGLVGRNWKEKGESRGTIVNNDIRILYLVNPTVLDLRLSYNSISFRVPPIKVRRVFLVSEGLVKIVEPAGYSPISIGAIYVDQSLLAKYKETYGDKYRFEPYHMKDGFSRIVESEKDNKYISLPFIGRTWRELIANRPDLGISEFIYNRRKYVGINAEKDSEKRFIKHVYSADEIILPDTTYGLTDLMVNVNIDGTVYSLPWRKEKYTWSEFIDRVGVVEAFTINRLFTTAHIGIKNEENPMESRIIFSVRGHDYIQPNREYKLQTFAEFEKSKLPAPIIEPSADGTQYFIKNINDILNKIEGHAVHKLHICLVRYRYNRSNKYSKIRFYSRIFGKKDERYDLYLNSETFALENFLTACQDIVSNMAGVASGSDKKCKTFVSSKKLRFGIAIADSSKLKKDSLVREAFSISQNFLEYDLESREFTSFTEIPINTEPTISDLISKKEIYGKPTIIRHYRLPRIAVKTSGFDVLNVDEILTKAAKLDMTDAIQLLKVYGVTNQATLFGKECKRCNITCKPIPLIEGFEIDYGNVSDGARHFYGYSVSSLDCKRMKK